MQSLSNITLRKLDDDAFRRCRRATEPASERTANRRALVLAKGRGARGRQHDAVLARARAVDKRSRRMQPQRAPLRYAQLTAGHMCSHKWVGAMAHRGALSTLHNSGGAEQPMPLCSRADSERTRAVRNARHAACALWHMGELQRAKHARA